MSPRSLLCSLTVSWYTSNTFPNQAFVSLHDVALRQDPRFEEDYITVNASHNFRLSLPPPRTHAVLSPSRMWALQQDLQQVVENSFRKKAWGIEILTFWQRIKFFYLSFDLLKAFSRKRFAWIIHRTSHTRGKKCECCGWKECPPPSQGLNSKNIIFAQK